MAYPRECVGCGASYAAWNGAVSFPHQTVAARDGGTPSPWRPELPGRLLDLRCELCGALYRWDYFGAGADESRLGRAVDLLLPPLASGRVMAERTAEGRRRAS